MNINNFHNLVIAEIGSVHDGSFGNALKLIELAKKCGANMVKFQTHIASAETLKNAPMPYYFKGEPRYEYFERTSFTKDQWLELSKFCMQKEIEFLSSPFSIEAAELLNEINLKMFKIPSGEVTNIPLLEKISSFGKPVILSSGMSNWKELDRAVEILKDNVELCIMQCTSKYPCPIESVGLNVLQEIKDRYGKNIVIGFSDHTSGISAGAAAAAYGAKVIEKHLTFSKLMYGSDALNSLEPDEFKLYNKVIKEIWLMEINPVDKDNIKEYSEMKKIFQKSIFSARDIVAGESINFNDIVFKKPGDGISPAMYKDLLGKKVNKNLENNHKFSWDDINS